MPVLVFSVEEGAEMALRSLRAGASGFVSKAESPATLLTAIRAVLAGQRYLPSSLAGLVTSRLLDAGNGVEDRSLTDRESEVFEMLAVGCSTGQIAAALHVSVKTVETYYDRLKQKYSVHTSRELLAVAARCHRCPGCPFEGRANRTALAARAPYRGNVW
jgi:DNA-binding NarL/FixJ family response regulator